MIDPALKDALRRLRRVRSQRPSESGSLEFATWREHIAEALDALVPVLLFEEDRTRARAEAETARVEAAEIRARQP